MADMSNTLPMQKRANFLSRHQLDIQTYRMIPFWIGVALSPIAFPWTRLWQWTFIIVALSLMYLVEHFLRKAIDQRIGWSRPDYRAIQNAEPRTERRSRRYRMMAMYIIASVTMTGLLLMWPGSPGSIGHHQSLLRNMGGMWPFQALIQCLRVACDQSNPQHRRISYSIATSALIVSYPAAMRLPGDQMFLSISTAIIMIAAAISDLRLLLQLAPPRDESEAA